MDTKEKLIAFLDSKVKDFSKISDKIWDFAELQFKEKKSSELLSSVLENEGFTVEKNVAGIKTAFIASYGSGNPVIGILGEFDALSNMSQKSGVTHKEPLVEGAPGHGCGHHLLGTGSLAACIAVKEYLKETGMKGTIKFFGCPAEEGGAGKVFMVRSGCFEGVDVAMTWHPASQNMVWEDSSLATNQVYFNFKGISSHAAASPHLGRSALDAVELMNVGVNYLREHIISDARVHYAVTNTGGIAPNIVQAEATVLYLMRAPHISQVRDIYSRVCKIADGAALMTETQVETKFDTGECEYRPNIPLTKLIEKNLKEVLPIANYTQEDISLAKSMIDTMPSMDGFLHKLEDKKLVEYIEETGICNGFIEGTNGLGSGSTDVGDVSWVVPTAQFTTSCAACETPMHSWQLVAQGKSNLAHQGMITAAKTMALSAFDILQSPQVLQEIKEAFEKDFSQEKYICPIPEEVLPGY
ncbi:amidohydrolase [Clostridium sp. MSJ-11]|uniref:Amidohydrolase n=1 Tax=Clostridium mobile TaxID=2841512 RepID=A0ABS6EH28_9CLOT|nr:M20 family metallopeptidase [Clostridium mobile]MBU5484515.1 amidohydrolase [Clostridium mobile]